MTSSPTPSPEGPAPEDRRINRLAAAMEAFLSAPTGPDAHARERFLAQHKDLRDLLEPMLDDNPTDDGEHAQPSANTLEPGQIVGDYRIEREVGRGGMGTVYEAEQLSLKRRVALKVLHPQLTMHATSIERFRREAAAVARLRHQGIVPIHEVGDWRGLHYFSMEFVEGRALKARIHEPHLGIVDASNRPHEAAELVALVADALQHAHEHQLVHRDVKPQNILIGDDGSVWLLDFGLVKNLTEPSHSVTAGFFGTPHYCSPEQVQPDAVVGPTTDVFSLGIVLYELLARSRPFEGESSRAVMDRIRIGDFVPLTRAAPSTPRDLVTICHKALEPEPARRYGSAKELADDLRRFLRHEPIAAHPPNAITRAWKWSRRHRGRLLVWSAAAVLLLGAPITYAWHQHNTAFAIERERKVLGDAEELGFRSIEQTLSLLGDLLHRIPGPPRQTRQQVDHVVQQCEDFLQFRAQDPARCQRVALALLQASYVYGALDHFTRALACCQRSRDVLDSVVKVARSNEAINLRRRLQLRAACLRQRLQPLRDDAGFIAHLDAYRGSETPPAPPAREMAETLLARGHAMTREPKYLENAPMLLRRALELLPAERCTDFPSQLLRLRCRIDLGVAFTRSRRFPEALRELNGAQTAIDELPGAPIVAVERVRARLAIDNVRRLSGVAAASEGDLRAAVELAKHLLDEYPGTLALRRTLANSQLYLSTRLLASGKIHEAEACAREVRERHQHDSPTWHHQLLCARIDMQIACCVAISGDDARLEEARALAVAACEQFDQVLAEDPSRLAGAVDGAVDMGGGLSNVAAIENRVGNYQEAERFARRAIAIQRRVLTDSPGHERAREFCGIHHAQLAYALAKQDDAAAVADAAEQTRNLITTNVSAMRIAAQAACVCATSTAADHDLREHCAEIAVALLRKIAETNRQQGRQQLRSEAFRALHGRSDFAALREEFDR